MSKREKTAYKIEKNVRIPNTNESYPFGKMDVGDSFQLKPGDDLRRVRGAATNWGSEHNKRFSVRRGEDGIYRCWRVPLKEEEDATRPTASESDRGNEEGNGTGAGPAGGEAAAEETGGEG